MMKNGWMVLPLLIAAGCSSNNSATVNVTLTSVATATSAACPNGGVTITSGIDINGDGVLEPTEVTSTQSVCNGGASTTTHDSLVSTTSLPPGNSHCANGGTEIDTGSDNGAGGGTADDGILQPGEITSTQYVCTGGTESSALVSTTTLPIGDSHCANGGTEIESGIDNGAGGGIANDGILQSGEVTETQYVCTGASEIGTLVSTTILQPGDTNCPNGGTEIATGLDNGAGGGIAGDGVLQVGEITQTQYVCNNASDGIPLYVGALTPPASPAGAYTINTSGGNGSSGSGGNGNEVTLESTHGTLGGHVKIFNTGVVDASFTIPDITFNAGETPFSVTEDTELNSYPGTTAGLESGDAFFEVPAQNTASGLFENIDGAATAVTSIDVAADVTLTLANNDSNSTAYFYLEGDMRNAGTITTASQSGDTPGNLQLVINNFIGEAGSHIVLNGGLESSGGYFNITCNGTFINAGEIDTFGGPGGEGNDAGDGNNIDVNANGGGGIFNTGTLNSQGGSTTADNTGGGQGGNITLQVNYGPLDNSGPLIATGGAGTSSSNSGGQIQLTVNSVGSIRNSGDLFSNGGNGTTGADGSSANEIDFSNNGGGDILNSGSINTSGGSGIGGGSGGSGSNLNVNNCDCNSANNGNINVPTGSIRFSGNINTSGGAGSNGGDAGDIDMNLDVQNYPAGQEIELLGYTDVILNGGSSAGDDNSGGNGGELDMQYDHAANSPGNNNNNYGPAGAVLNYANVSTRGGDGNNGDGGSGGEVYMQTQRDTNFNSTFEFVGSFGTIDGTGGATTVNGDSGGNGAYIEFDGINGVQNAGTITVSSGTASGLNVGNNGANSIYFTSDVGPITNRGDLTASGGSALGHNSQGGQGGNINFYGVGINNSGALTCDGGDGSATGGDGGTIYLFSSAAGPTVNSAALAVDGGNGDNGGNEGSIQVDGANVGP